MGAIGRDPIFIARGEGAELIDVDGNRYVDYVCSWGPLIHGHAHPHVLEAIAAAAANGTSFGAPTAGEVELAAEIARRVPGVEMVRMTSSGTEATMTAMRLARAATGRERVLKFAGAYHGHLDGLLAEAGSGLATQALPASPGVPACGRGRDRGRALERPRGARSPRPRPTSWRRSSPSRCRPTWASFRRAPGFLELLRERADASGALLVLDEVISGFRVARGGAQELTGVRADLTIMGKVIGGGLPAAAVGGRAELMRHARARRRGLPGGDAVGQPAGGGRRPGDARAAGRAAYLRLGAITERLAEGLREAAGGYPVQVVGAPGLLTVFFSERPVTCFAGRARVRPGRACGLVPGAARARRLSAAVAVRGVVPVAGPHRRAARAHARGGRGRVRGAARPGAR